MGNSKIKTHILADRCGLPNPISKSMFWTYRRSRSNPIALDPKLFLLAHAMRGQKEPGWDALLFPVMMVILIHSYSYSMEENVKLCLS